MSLLVIRVSALATLGLTALAIIAFGLEFDFVAEGGWIRSTKQRLHQEELSLLGGFSVLAVAVMGIINRTLFLREQVSRKEAERDAFTDPLTGLSNRRCFLKRAGLEMERSGSDKPDLCLLLIDLDHFKEINDNLGHAAGDAVLVEVAVRLKQCFPQALSVSRLGGDEFVVLEKVSGVAARWARTAVDQFSARWNGRYSMRVN
jgi:GGDEF domain-containing protein